MDISEILTLGTRYGGGLFFLALVIGAIFWLSRQILNQGADVGITSLQAALKQNETDRIEMRAEIAQINKELVSLRKYARALRAYVNVNLPHATDVPEFDTMMDDS